MLLISGIAISLLCSAVGLFLVLRRFSLFGDALAHSAFGGVAFGLFIGIYPLWIACSVAILSALGLTKIRQKFDISSDAIVAILLATGLGAGVILVSLTDDLDMHDIEEFLFGSAIIDTQNVITILVMAGAILAILFFTYKKLLYSTFSEEQAKACLEFPVDKMGYLLIAIAGVTVVISMQLVGVLLISALFVIPNVSSMLYGRSFKQTIHDHFNVHLPYPLPFQVAYSYHISLTLPSLDVLYWLPLQSSSARLLQRVQEW